MDFLLALNQNCGRKLNTNEVKLVNEFFVWLRKTPLPEFDFQLFSNQGQQKEVFVNANSIAINRIYRKLTTLFQYFGRRLL